MCGIVGAVAGRNVVPILLEGLKRLEYRGYDSAGIAVVNGRLERLRSTGRVAELARRADEVRLAGPIGVAHTRWATHGVPSERNAHPHVSGGLSVVHNGIIENHEEIRGRLQAEGYEFTSDTDTEVIAHLVHSKMAQGAALFEAVRLTVAELTGAYAIAVVNEEDPTRLVVARMGAPLLLGLGEGENFAASDTSALIQVTPRVVYLEEGDCAEVRRDGVRIVDAGGAAVERAVHVSNLTAAEVELGPYRHFMQKEIFEQPMAVANTLELVVNARGVSPQLFGAEAERILSEIDSVLILACGTSYHAGMVARYWLEGLAGVPCNVEIASEYRYRDSVPNPKALVVTISQSGETADTLAALHHARSLGQPVQPRDLQRAGVGARPAVAASVPDPRRPRDRGRVDQGLHDAARGPGAAHDDAGEGEAPAHAGTRVAAHACAAASARGAHARARTSSLRSRHGRRCSRSARTRSSSAAASTTRSRWKARSS